MSQKNNIYYKTDKILDIFFEKPDREFHFREITRLVGVSTTAVKARLKDLEKIGVITSKRKGNMIFFRARQTEIFKEAKRLFNIRKIRESKLTDYITKEMRQPEAIILFGSSSRGEDSEKSDIDIFVLSSVKNIDVLAFEKKLGRKINIISMTKKEFEEAKKKSPEFVNNVINGTRLEGYLKVL